MFIADWLRQGADECRKCRNLVSDGACVAQCPTMKYNYDNSSVCQRCHANCRPSAGCTGPGNGVGHGRCIGCAFVKLAADHTTVLECLSPDVEECEPGYYQRTHTSSSRVRNVVILVLTASRVNVVFHGVTINNVLINFIHHKGK